MSDRELLEMAAKAAGIMWYGYCGDDSTECHYFDIGPDDVVKWNPLRDDGDAFRLITRLRLVADASFTTAEVRYFIAGEQCPRGNRGGDNTDENMRRCIVRAAAEIGRTIP